MVVVLVVIFVSVSLAYLCDGFFMVALVVSVLWCSCSLASSDNTRGRCFHSTLLLVLLLVLLLLTCVVVVPCSWNTMARTMRNSMTSVGMLRRLVPK